MITVESSSNKDIIFSCSNTENNKLIVKLIVALMNKLDERRTFQIGGI